VITGPAVVSLRLASLDQGVSQVSVGIHHNRSGHVTLSAPFLAPCFTQQVLRKKNRRKVIMFVIDDVRSLNTVRGSVLYQ
jgi:hypothetical protein